MLHETVKLELLEVGHSKPHRAERENCFLRKPVNSLKALFWGVGWSYS